MPDPGWLGRKERNKYFVYHFRKNAFAVVTHRETANFSGDLFQLYFYLRCSILSAGLFGIFNQIDQHLLYLGTINVQSGPPVCCRKMNERIREEFP